MGARRIRIWAGLGLLAGILWACQTPAGAWDRRTGEKGFESSAAHSPGTEYSSGFLVEAYAEGVLLVSVSGVSGTPTLVITAQTSDDNSTYYHHSAVASITASGATAYTITNFGKYLRMKEVISGDTTDTITYEITGVFKN